MPTKEIMSEDTHIKKRGLVMWWYK